MAVGEQDRASGRRRRRRLSDLPLRRRIIAIAVLAALPIVILAGIELVLRVAGFGGYPPTFVEGGSLADGSTLVFSDEMGPASFFFTGRSQGLALDPVPLVDPKPANTARVVWVGGSAAKGIPQPRPLRASRFLQAMLSDLMPDRDVEVINLGVPGIASYPVMGVLTDALRYEPDLVVVYAGNNEYYGAFGVASLHSAGRSPAMIRTTRAVRSTAMSQAMDRLIRRKVVKPPGSLMEAMVREPSIAPEDPKRAAAARNLETFIGDMIDRCRSRGIPIIVCTLPANESGMAPLGEDEMQGLPVEDRDRVTELIALGGVLVDGDPADAEGMLREALAVHPDHALAHHLLGRALREQGRFDEAASAFRRGVDLDPMPWRAPSSSNEAIRRAADTRGATLADLDRAFHEAAEHGLVGWDLVEDHVHPSLRGQELVARTVLEAMTRLDGPLAPDADAVAQLPGWEAYADRLGRNRYDRYAVACAMVRLGSISFFARNNAEMRERNAAIRREIEAGERRPVVVQLRRWAHPSSGMVDVYPITGLVADTLLKLGETEEAGPLFRVAALSSTPYGSRSLAFWYHALGCDAQVNGGLDEADMSLAREMIDRGRFLIGSGRSASGRAEQYVGQLLQLTGDDAMAVAYLKAGRQKIDGPRAIALDEAIVLAYVKTGAPERASEVIDAGLNGPHRQAYLAMRRHLR